MSTAKLSSQKEQMSSLNDRLRNHVQEVKRDAEKIRYLERQIQGFSRFEKIGDVLQKLDDFKVHTIENVYKDDAYFVAETQKLSRSCNEVELENDKIKREIMEFERKISEDKILLKKLDRETQENQVEIDVCKRKKEVLNKKISNRRHLHNERVKHHKLKGKLDAKLEKRQDVFAEIEVLEDFRRKTLKNKLESNQNERRIINEKKLELHRLANKLHEATARRDAIELEILRTEEEIDETNWQAGIIEKQMKDKNTSMSKYNGVLKAGNVAKKAKIEELVKSLENERANLELVVLETEGKKKSLNQEIFEMAKLLGTSLSRNNSVKSNRSEKSKRRTRYDPVTDSYIFLDDGTTATGRDLEKLRAKHEKKKSQEL